MGAEGEGVQGGGCKVRTSSVGVWKIGSLSLSLRLRGDIRSMAAARTASLRSCRHCSFATLVHGSGPAPALLHLQ